MAAKFCPLLKERVTYLFCEDCEEQICRGEKKKENAKEKKEGHDDGEQKE